MEKPREALQIGLLRCAFSDMYRDNIQLFLVSLFVIRITIKVAYTSFMCELMWLTQRS